MCSTISDPNPGLGGAAGRQCGPLPAILTLDWTFPEDMPLLNLLLNRCLIFWTIEPHAHNLLPLLGIAYLRGLLGLRRDK